MTEQQLIERWTQRARFFRTSVILDVVCPVIGASGLVWLLLTESASIPAYVACGGALGLPGIGALGDLVSDARR